MSPTDTAGTVLAASSCLLTRPVRDRVKLAVRRPLLAGVRRSGAVS